MSCHRSSTGRRKTVMKTPNPLEDKKKKQLTRHRRARSSRLEAPLGALEAKRKLAGGFLARGHCTYHTPYDTALDILKQGGLLIPVDDLVYPCCTFVRSGLGIQGFC
jgi:hypothetical protein